MQEFYTESEMTAPAIRWMEDASLIVKHEFVTPWGKCDLAGLQFDDENVCKRLDLRQTKAVGSVVNAAILLTIPDVESNESTTVEKLHFEHHSWFPEDTIRTAINRLVQDHFVIEYSGGRLQKVNGWLPIHRRLVAIELKLSRVEEVLQQARNNLEFATESFAALPTEIADRVCEHRIRWKHFFDAGVGLLRVSTQRCEVLIPSANPTANQPEALSFYCAEKFWRTRHR